jgi:hypothetical protein
MERADDIDETLRILSNSIRRIQLSKQLPEDRNLRELDAVQGCALLLASAVVDYLTIAIQYLSRSLARSPA